MQANRSRVGLVVAIVLLAFYFWSFTRVSLTTGFSNDDLMNLVFAWRAPLADIVKANFLLPTDVLRPVGQLFYASFLQWFGLEAGPYRAFCYLILWLNAGLTFFVLRMISRSDAVAAAGVLLHCYHPNFFSLYYGSGNCYDVFCFFFYFTSLAVVVYARQNGRLLGRWESISLAILSVCALNSKESAASLAPVLLAYELFFCGPPRSVSWIWREGRAVLICGAILLVFLYSRFSGSNNLLSHSAYHPVLTLDRYLQSTAYYLTELSGVANWWTSSRAALLLGSMTTMALLLRDRKLGFATAMVVLAAAPIAFIEQRGLVSYYIALAGYALFFAVLLLRPVRGRRLAEAMAFLVLYAAMWNWQTGRQKDMAVYWQEWAHIQGAIADCRRHPEWFTPNSSLLIANDPFPENSWGPQFVATLVGQQPAMNIHTYVNMQPRPNQAEINAYTHVIGYRNGHFVELDRTRLQ